MDSAGAAVAAAMRRLEAAGVDTARLDARMLVAHVLGLTPQAVFTHPETPLTEAQAIAVAALVDRRVAREPVSRILGRRGFWTLDLAVGPDTLDPRPDTETVVEAVLNLVDRTAPLRLLDFGTGSGCLLLALLTELPAAHGIGIDRSLGALAVAGANAKANGLAGRASFVQADWGDGVAGSFDVIVSNPPYIRDGDIAGLEPEVKDHDPHLALAGGDDGLACYRALAPHIARLLAPGGLAALEVGEGQAEDVAALLVGAGLIAAGLRRDLAGSARCVLARKISVGK
jgi:release factor glutamine methyltransferase